MALLTVGSSEAASAQAVDEARRSDFVDTVAGIPVPDPYRWMEEMDAREVVSWARAQDSIARAYTAAWPGRDALEADIARSADHFRYMPPLRGGDRYYFTRVNSSATRVDLLSTAEEYGASSVILEGDALATDGLVLDRQIWPSPSGRYVAVGVGPIGSRWIEARVWDVARGEFLPDRVPGLVGGRISNLSWAPDESGFFYDGYRPPEGDRRSATFADSHLGFHALGTPTADDRRVLGVEDEGWTLTHDLTDDGRFLVVSSRDGRSAGNRVHLLSATEGFRSVTPLLDGVDHPFQFVGNDGDEIWLRTTLDAPNGRVVGIRLGQETSSLREIVPEQDGAIDDWTGARAVGDRVVVGYRIGGLLHVRSFEPGGDGTEIPMPRIGSIWTGFVGKQGDSRLYFVVSGFADPGTVFRHDLSDGRTEVFRQPDLPYDPSEIETRRVFYSSGWGDSIPMYVAHQRDTEMDGRRPTMIYGYGFGRWSASPWFRPHMAEWFRMGGVFALPAIRGGGELGEAWHAAGVGQNRQNAIDDYIDASQWLIEAGVTSPERLVAETNSAGGSLVAAAVQQRPDLYGAAVYGFPVLDMVRFASFTGGQRWRSEFGDPADVDDLRSILAYSPVHNRAVGGCHPPTLVTPGELDETTPPAHAYKFVAAARAHQTCDSPVLMRIAWGAEHSYGRDQETTVASFADQLSFLGRVLDLEGRW